MTQNPITSAIDTSLQTVLERLAKNKIRHMPIVDQRGHLLGIISKRDMLSAHLVPKTVADDRVASQIMTRDIVTVSPESCACSAADSMYKNKFGSLPVVNDGGELQGIITEADFVRLFAFHAPCACRWAERRSVPAS